MSDATPTPPDAPAQDPRDAEIARLKADNAFLGEDAAALRTALIEAQKEHDNLIVAHGNSNAELRRLIGKMIFGHPDVQGALDDLGFTRLTLVRQKVVPDIVDTPLYKLLAAQEFSQMKRTGQLTEVPTGSEPLKPEDLPVHESVAAMHVAKVLPTTPPEAEQPAPPPAPAAVSIPSAPTQPAAPAVPPPVAPPKKETAVPISRANAAPTVRTILPPPGGWGTQQR